MRIGSNQTNLLLQVSVKYSSKAQLLEIVDQIWNGFTKSKDLPFKFKTPILDMNSKTSALIQTLKPKFWNLNLNKNFLNLNLNMVFKTSTLVWTLKPQL